MASSVIKAEVGGVVLADLSIFEPNTLLSMSTLKWSIPMFFILSFLRWLMVNKIYPSLFHRWASVEEKEKKGNDARFSESLWFFTYYSFTTVFAITALPLEESFRNPSSFFIGYPKHDYSPVQRMYMAIQTGYYMSSLLYLFFETRMKHKDLPMMVIHHLSSVILLEGSNLFRYQRLCIFSVFLHDTGDVFLESSKALHYLGFGRAKTWDFVVFAFVFSLTRCVIYPWKCIYTTWIPAAALAAPVMIPHHIFFNIFQTVMFTLDTVWCVFIWVMAWRMVQVGELGGDIRSEDEGVCIDQSESE